MKITITGEHEGKTVTIAVWTSESGIIHDTDVTDEIMNVLKREIEFYVRNYVK